MTSKPIQTGIAVALALIVVLILTQMRPASFESVPSDDAVVPIITNETTTTMSETVTELQVTDLVAGSGAPAAAGDQVTVNYVGSLTNGRIFDASANHGAGGFTFTLGAGKVIRGWDQGVEGMRVGGKRRLVIPPALAYGNQAVGGVIPANSTLVFEIELLNVQKVAR